ncbi:hypothetical protein SAMN06265222_101922 [Neorhodopirellula lusitana]|uniref:Uncharacterized protein n=2 Tax=Neorhodopirellula lusitana TaxID=445327 RepID=A0ABY1PR21_9BACT|nr:hypothetical protein SAMN06265222_101922 [Neorhodopirellula lusitana]
MATTTGKKPTRKTTTSEPQMTETPMTDTQLREAVVQLLEREQQAREQRELDKKREEEAAVARKEQETEAAMNRMARSVEIIKYCVLSISSVMAISLVIGILVLMEVQREAERIKGEVVEIEREAERIYEKLSNPLAAVGASFDRELKQRLGLFPSDDAPSSQRPEE